MKPELFINKLLDQGYDLYTGVPCSYLKSLINFVNDDERLEYYPMNNEGEAVAFAFGASLAGKKPVVMFQNSGLGNAVNPLTSMSYSFRVPMLLICTWRGQPGFKDEPQHELMGQITPQILSLCQVEHQKLNPDLDKILKDVHAHTTEKSLPYGLIVENNFFEEYKLKKSLRVSPASLPVTQFTARQNLAAPALTRFEAIQVVGDYSQKKHTVLGTTGKTGRELFVYGDHPNHLYVVGSMGCASTIGLGLALQLPDEKKVFVLDGDGAALMRMEAMASIGFYAPKNFIQIILDNQMHDSTGGQQTLSSGIEFSMVAAACGYRSYSKISSEAELRDQISHAMNNDGPHLIHLKIKPGSITDLPRPGIPPHQVKERLMEFLKT